MEFTALRILFWDGDGEGMVLDEFLKDLYACYLEWTRKSTGGFFLLDVVLGHVCSTTSATDYRNRVWA